MQTLDQPVGTNPLKAGYWLGKIDLRPIALFRIGLGLFLVYDLLDFAPDLRAWFSDEGVMPRWALLGQWARSTRFVLLDAFGTPALVWIYWALAMVAALALTLGYRTRLASIASFVLMAGFQERLPPLFDGSDTVLRLMLFWHMLTPSGNVWSIDALRAAERGQPLAPSGFALPVRLTQLQVGWVYFCSVFYKLQGSTWHDGTAVHYCLHLNHVFARDWAASIADVRPLVMFITYFTLVLEASFIFLTHAPMWHRKLKALALLGGTGLHFGIFLTINVGHFSFLMPLTYLCLFEPEWAQAVFSRATALFDPVRWRARLLRLAGSIPEPMNLSLHPTARNLGWAAAAAFFAVVSWYSMPKSVVPTLPPALDQFVQYTSMWSSWDMFAPEPLRTDYRLSAPAVFEDGSTADLFGGPAGGKGEVRGFFFTRWWKYMENVTGGGETLPLEWGRYLCREHNFRLPPGQPRLYTFTLYKDNQVIPPMGAEWPPVQRVAVWNHRCFDKPSDNVAAPPPVALQSQAH